MNTMEERDEKWGRRNVERELKEGKKEEVKGEVSGRVPLLALST